MLLPSLVIPVAGQILLGEAGHYSLTYTVSYQGLPQPGGSITFVNALSNSYYVNQTLTNPRITAVEIFAAFGNYSVTDPYPIYFTSGDRLLNQTVQIPCNTALGRYAVTAVAFYQLSYVTLQGEVWHNAASVDSSRQRTNDHAPSGNDLKHTYRTVQVLASYPPDLPINRFTPVPPRSDEGSKEN